MKNRLRELRKEKGLTLNELSNELLEKLNFKIGSNALGKYERGEREPKLNTWQELANFFNVPVPYLQGIGTSRDEMLEFLIELYWRYSLETDEKYRVDEDGTISNFLEYYVLTSEDYDKITSFMRSDGVGFETDEDIQKANIVLRKRFSDEILFLNDYNKLASITEKLDTENLMLVNKIYDFINEDGLKRVEIEENERKKAAQLLREKQLQEYGFSIDALLELIRIFKVRLDGYSPNELPNWLATTKGIFSRPDLDRKELKKIIDEVIANLQYYSNLLK